MKVKNNKIRYLLMVAMFLLILLAGKNVFAANLTVVGPDPNSYGPYEHSGNGNPAYFCIEPNEGWGIKSKPNSHVSIDSGSVIVEYTSESGYMENSISFGIYTAEKEGVSTDLKLIQYLVWSSGYYKGLPNYTETIQKFNPNDRLTAMGYKVVQRADQYAQFYYGILGGGNDLKMNLDNQSSKVYIDQSNHTLTVGPYKVDIDRTNLEKAQKQAYYKDSVKNAMETLYNELSGTNKNNYPNAPEFAKYTLTMDGVDKNNNVIQADQNNLEFIDKDGNVLKFPNWNEEFYIRYKNVPDGILEVKPKINIEYMKEIIGQGEYYKQDVAKFSGTRTEVDILEEEFNENIATGYVDGNIEAWDTWTKDGFEINKIGLSKNVSVKVTNATKKAGKWVDHGYDYPYYDEKTGETTKRHHDDWKWHVTSFDFDAELTERDVLQELLITGSITPMWMQTEINLGPKDISIELGGHTWKDLPSLKVGGYDGIRNKEDEAYAGMLVQLFDTDGNLVRTTTTDENGEYHFKKLDPFKKYDVLFTYNGQLYMATEYQNNIAWDGGYSNAKEVLRNRFNKKFQTIDATPKNYNGKRAFPFLQKINKNGTMTFEYVWNRFERANIADNSTVSDETISNSYNNGYSAIASVYDAKAIKQYIRDCMIDARTPVSYPVYDKFVTEDLNNPPRRKTQTKIGNESFEFLYTKESDQSRFVDFGVYRRDTLELALQKDLYKATVQINGKSHDYIYNKKTEGQLGNRDWYVNVRQSDYLYNGAIYNRPLRKSEYLYDGNIYGNDIYDANNGAKNLQVYVTYRIAVLNRSQSIEATINEIVDYYDKNQYTFVKATVNPDDKVSTLSSSEKSSVKNVNRIESKGFGAQYITEDIKLAPGELKTLYITFKVNNDNQTQKVMLDLNTVGKRNIAEITGYSTKEGIVDSLSNPGNLESADLDNDGNILPRGYEPDTDKAPNFKLIIDTEKDRVISGYVFEDVRTEKYNNATVGNGLFNSNNETKINGVTVELVELVQKVDSQGKATGEYLGEKVWGTAKYDKNFKLISEDKTRYYSGNEYSKVILTGPEGNALLEVKADKINNPEGEYAFKSVPPGDFFIRFTYGDTVQTVLMNANALPEATEQEKSYKQNVKAVNELVQNSGLNAKSYNGQDFKSTVYQSQKEQSKIKSYNGIKGFVNANTQNYNGAKDKGAMYLYDLNNNISGISDAKDVYSYRENANSYSKGADAHSLVNNRSEILASFERVGTGVTTKEEQQKMIENLMNNTKMVAQTGVIDTEIEYNSTNTNVNNKEGNNQEKETSQNAYDYIIGDVDLGLSERPRAGLKLNKEVSNFKLSLANGNVIFNSNQQVNNLIYMKHDGHKANYKNNLLTSVTLGKNNEKLTPELLQAYLDEELIAGSTIQVTYALTVENIGEVDYLDKLFYYTGKTSDNSARNISKTNARTVIDYVSNLIEYDNKYQEENLWNVKNAEQLISSSKLNKDGSISVTGNIDADLVNRHYLDKISTYNRLITTNKLSKDLLPSIQNKNESTQGIQLVLTKKLANTSGDEEYIYNNLAEIVEVSNSQGRRMQFSIVGNQEMADQSLKTKNTAENVNSSIKIVTPSEIDSDSAQKVVILPPLGEKHITTIIITTIASLAIIAIGIVVIKKYTR